MTKKNTPKTSKGAKGQRKAGGKPTAPALALVPGNERGDNVRDALRGRHVNRFGQLSRTRAIHEVLYAAYERREGLKPRQIAGQATNIMLAIDAHNGGNGMRSDGKPIACRALSAHLNTMIKEQHGRQYAERRDDGLYWLTPVGAFRCKADMTPDDRQRLKAIQAAYAKAQKEAAQAEGKAPPAKKSKKAKSEK